MTGELVNGGTGELVERVSSGRSVNLQTGQPSEGSVGAVLVVGAGIGGMQASLDLAQAGFKVYLTVRCASSRPSWWSVGGIATSR